VAVVLFWCLSPLGGQSSLRLLRADNSTISETHEIFYSSSTTDSKLVEDAAVDASRVSALVLTSILTGDKLYNSSTDFWNHLKIPRLKELELEKTNNEEASWFDVKIESDTNYTSLIGVNVLGLRPNTMAVFSAFYEYLYLDCKTHMHANSRETLEFFQSMSDLIVPSGWPYNSTETDDYSRLFNATFLTPTTPIHYNNSFFLVGVRSNLTVYSSTESIFYGSKDFGGQTIATYECSLHSLMVEAKLNCFSAACSVKQMRRSLEPQDRTSLFRGRPWDVAHRETASRFFFRYFSNMGGIIPSSERHPIDAYIQGNWDTVFDARVSQHLTEVVNTYWDSSRWISTAARFDPYTSETHAQKEMAWTDAIITRQVLIYKASVLWILLLFLCSGTLLFLGIANVVVAFQISVPDIFGYVLSLTRENLYVDVPEGGTMLSGTDRTRLIKDLKVQLADVRHGDGVGYITLKSLEGDIAIGKGLRMRKDKLYS
jgi:hypothetical protein